MKHAFKDDGYLIPGLFKCDNIMHEVRETSISKYMEDLDFIKGTTFVGVMNVKLQFRDDIFHCPSCYTKTYDKEHPTVIGHLEESSSAQ